MTNDLKTAARAALRYLEKRRDYFAVGSAESITFDAVVESLRAALAAQVPTASPLPLIAPLSAAAKRAIAKYTETTCREAFRMHDERGEGASTVGIYLGLKTNQADAAINAGRELAGRA